MSLKVASRFFPDSGILVPRFRQVGEVTLDLFHRDGRVDDQWLAFPPLEFELLWRLAEETGRRVTERQLLIDIWRTEYESETNCIAAHIARIRSKLEPLGLACILATHPDGGYLINAPQRDIDLSFADNG